MALGFREVMEQWKEAVLVGKGIKVISRQAGFREGFPGGRKGGSSDIALRRAYQGQRKRKVGSGGYRVQWKARGSRKWCWTENLDLEE